MKMFSKILYLLFVTIFLSCSVQNKSNKVFELYPTEDDLVVLRLDTRQGFIWMIEGSTDSITNDQVLIQDHPLDFDNDPFIGRFELIPTQNIYNFMLIDKKRGNVYQVQFLRSDTRETDIKNGKGEGIVRKFYLDEKLKKRVYVNGEIFKEN